jgi:S-adenosylmethionine:diacylglycerol 3-amino-3-carboxypropyl transferase
MSAQPATAPNAAWARGDFRATHAAEPATGRILFGRMYEDPEIERAAFAPGGRVLCIASAGCTAMALADRHAVVAIDINPAQVAYAARRFAGGATTRGTAERVMAAARVAAPLVGWSRGRVRAFLELDDPAEQLAFWRDHLATRRFRFAVDILLSVTALRAVYSSPLLACLPRRLGAVMRARLERGIARHPMRDNPYARLLFAGQPVEAPVPASARGIELVCGDAASYLEAAPAGSFDGFTLSNILDGAPPAYAARLAAAVRRAAAPGAVAVLRSFASPATPQADARAADDRALIWGAIEVGPASAFGLVR